MTTTELDVVEHHRPPAAPVPHDWAAAWSLAQRIAGTPFVPGALRGKPESVLACILFGVELGIGPMQSLSSIHVIDGRPAAAPELMRALIARQGHRLDVTASTDEAVTVAGRRADTGAEARVTWTLDDARRAGLLGKGAWKTYPRSMLLARATSELARALFADVISGLSYTPEEVASIGDTAPTGWADAPAPGSISAPIGTDPASPDPAALFARVRAVAGTEMAERLRSLADKAGRRLSAADFAAHPIWAEVVAEVLDTVGPRLDPDDVGYADITATELDDVVVIEDDEADR